MRRRRRRFQSTRGILHDIRGVGRACGGYSMSVLVATKRNAVIRAFYARLLAAVKPKKFALIACMRKLLTILNTMVRTG